MRKIWKMKKNVQTKIKTWKFWIFLEKKKTSGMNNKGTPLKRVVHSSQNGTCMNNYGTVSGGAK